MVVIDQYILGAFLVSSFGFIFLYSQLRRKTKKFKSNSKSERKDDYIKTSIHVDRRSDQGNGTDIIIVGAGVAGSALAYTLGKVLLSNFLLLRLEIYSLVFCLDFYELKFFYTCECVQYVFIVYNNLLRNRRLFVFIDFPLNHLRKRCAMQL